MDKVKTRITSKLEHVKVFSWLEVRRQSEAIWFGVPPLGGDMLSYPIPPEGGTPSDRRGL